MESREISLEWKESCYYYLKQEYKSKCDLGGQNAGDLKILFCKLKKLQGLYTKKYELNESTFENHF